MLLVSSIVSMDNKISTIPALYISLPGISANPALHVIKTLNRFFFSIECDYALTHASQDIGNTNWMRRGSLGRCHVATN